MRLWPFGKQKNLNSVPSSSSGGWFGIVREPFTTAWQQNKELAPSQVRSFFAIYSCMTLISADISKMAAEVKRRNSDGVWNVIENDTSILLDKPNRFQNSVQFRQWWATSKLSAGNTYALKERTTTGVIKALYILDPSKVMPLIASDGSIYYQLNTDELSGIQENQLVVPSSEIIHDRYQPQFHPLVGVSPIYAAALAGALGKKIQSDSHEFFSNGAAPGGILSAPGAIGDETASRLKEHWDANYSGKNAGKVAVVGDGLKFEPMKSKSVDSQLVEQLRLSADIVASCFHVPPFKIGMDNAPSKPQEANLTYYSDCLQVLIEEFEACMKDGLELPPGTIIELDTDDLMRMDKITQIEMLAKAVGGSVMTPNAAMLELNQKPVEGGDTIYMQQQNYSLEALSRRDALPDPFSSAPSITTTPSPIEDEKEEPVLDEDDIINQAKLFAIFLEKELDVEY